jgi:hypothetical protein
MGHLRIKRRSKRLELKNLTINTSPRIRMSELISKYSADYINMGETTEERQSYLNGACTAWNIAILDENLREGALSQAIEGYKRINPGIEDVKNFEHDLRKLIQKKLEMFPNMKKVIVDAMIEPISETKYQINIASTEDKELLKEIFKNKLTL